MALGDLSGRHLDVTFAEECEERIDDLCAIALAALAVACPPAAAQDNWPSRAVKLISPFPAGGTSDVMARMVAEGRRSA